MHQVFVQWLSCRQLYIEPELYCVYKKHSAEEPDTFTRAKEHNEEQHETCRTRTTQPHAYEKGNLQCLLSVHVDGIKGVATKEVAEPLLKHLNPKVGRCNADYDTVLHTGVQHEHVSGEVVTHRYV